MNVNQSAPEPTPQVAASAPAVSNLTNTPVTNVYVQQPSGGDEGVKLMLQALMEENKAGKLKTKAAVAALDAKLAPIIDAMSKKESPASITQDLKAAAREVLAEIGGSRFDLESKVEEAVNRKLRPLTPAVGPIIAPIPIRPMGSIAEELDSQSRASTPSLRPFSARPDTLRPESTSLTNASLYDAFQRAPSAPPTLSFPTGLSKSVMQNMAPSNPGSRPAPALNDPLAKYASVVETAGAVNGMLGKYQAALVQSRPSDDRGISDDKATVMGGVNEEVPDTTVLGRREEYAGETGVETGRPTTKRLAVPPEAFQDTATEIR